MLSTVWACGAELRFIGQSWLMSRESSPHTCPRCLLSCQHHLSSMGCQCIHWAPGFAHWLPTNELWELVGDEILPGDIHGYEYHMCEERILRDT